MGWELSRGEFQEAQLLSHSPGSPMSQHWQGPQELGAGASSSHARRNQAAWALGLPPLSLLSCAGLWWGEAIFRGLWGKKGTDHRDGLQKSSLLV